MHLLGPPGHQLVGRHPQRLSRPLALASGFSLSRSPAREEDVPNGCTDLQFPLTGPETFRQWGLPPRCVVTMGSTASKPDPPYSTPLECLLANLWTLRLKGYIHPKQLTFLCSQAWPQYSLDNGSKWPATETLDFDILHDLDNYRRRMGKWSEVPYVQAFWALLTPPCALRALLAKSDSQCPPPDSTLPGKANSSRI